MTIQMMISNEKMIATIIQSYFKTTFLLLNHYEISFIKNILSNHFYLVNRFYTFQNKF